MKDNYVNFMNHMPAIREWKTDMQQLIQLIANIRGEGAGRLDAIRRLKTTYPNDLMGVPVPTNAAFLVMADNDPNTIRIQELLQRELKRKLARLEEYLAGNLHNQQDAPHGGALPYIHAIRGLSRYSVERRLRPANKTKYNNSIAELRHLLAASNEKIPNPLVAAAPATPPALLLEPGVENLGVIDFEAELATGLTRDNWFKPAADGSKITVADAPRIAAFKDAINQEGGGRPLITDVFQFGRYLIDHFLVERIAGGPDLNPGDPMPALGEPGGPVVPTNGNPNPHQARKQAFIDRNVQFATQHINLKYTELANGEGHKKAFHPWSITHKRETQKPTWRQVKFSKGSGVKTRDEHNFPIFANGDCEVHDPTQQTSLQLARNPATRQPQDHGLMHHHPVKTHVGAATAGIVIPGAALLISSWCALADVRGGHFYNAFHSWIKVNTGGTPIDFSHAQPTPVNASSLHECVDLLSHCLPDYTAHFNMAPTHLYHGVQAAAQVHNDNLVNGEVPHPWKIWFLTASAIAVGLLLTLYALKKTKVFDSFFVDKPHRYDPGPNQKVVYHKYSNSTWRDVLPWNWSPTRWGWNRRDWAFRGVKRWLTTTTVYSYKTPPHLQQNITNINVAGGGGAAAPRMPNYRPGNVAGHGYGIVWDVNLYGNLANRIGFGIRQKLADLIGRRAANPDPNAGRMEPVQPGGAPAGGGFAPPDPPLGGGGDPDLDLGGPPTPPPLLDGDEKERKRDAQGDEEQQRLSPPHRQSSSSSSSSSSSFWRRINPFRGSDPLKERLINSDDYDEEDAKRDVSRSGAPGGSGGGYGSAGNYPRGGTGDAPYATSEDFIDDNDLDGGVPAPGNRR